MVTTIIAITLLILMIFIFYVYTNYLYLNEEQTVKKEEKQEKKELPKNESHLSVLSNYSDGLIQSRVISLIINNGNFYTYSNKSSYHVKQLEIDNRVSILSYIKEGSIYKQQLLYGKLDIIYEDESLIFYKVSVEHRKMSVTYDSDNIRKTNYMFDSKITKEIKTDLNKVIEVILQKIKS